MFGEAHESVVLKAISPQNSPSTKKKKKNAHLSFSDCRESTKFGESEIQSTTATYSSSY